MMVGVDLTLVALSVLVSFSFSHLTLILPLAIFGPFWCLAAFSPTSLQAIFVLVSCLLFFAYLIRPNARTYDISRFGALLWLVSGFIALLSQQ